MKYSLLFMRIHKSLPNYKTRKKNKEKYYRGPLMNSKIYTCGDRNDEDVKEVLFKKKKVNMCFDFLVTIYLLERNIFLKDDFYRK